MNEKPTLEIIATTVEEALAQGLAQLGLPAEAVSMEVLDAGTKGLFGLGGRQVRVRLTIKSDEEETSSEATPPASKPARKPAPDSKKKAKPKQPKPEDPAPSITSKDDGNTDELLNLAEETVSKLLFHMNMQAQVSAHYEEFRP